jgi:hypothetical protein
MYISWFITKIQKQFSVHNLLLVLVLAGIVYRWWVGHNTLLLSTIMIWGFFFFHSRYFTYIAAIYLLLVIYTNIQGDHIGGEKYAIYFFRYLLLSYIVILLELYRKKKN